MHKNRRFLAKIKGEQIQTSDTCFMYLSLRIVENRKQKIDCGKVERNHPTFSSEARRAFLKRYL